MTKQYQSLRFALVVVLLTISASDCTADDSAEQFFENHVRPLLIEKCVGCHGARKQESGLRVDSRQALIFGGDSGPAIQPSNSAASRLMHAVRYTDDLQMPPTKKLSDREIDVLHQWIQSGATWPAKDAPLMLADGVEVRPHWAFEPVVRLPVPQTPEIEWVKGPVDAFVYSKLTEHGLQPSPVADRRTLMRRVAYTLTGLPPESEDVEAFVTDEDPRAYENLVQRLLDSPAHGEHWARQWLDVARYSDTKGYVYAREERHWTHAWAYRDWVVRSLNEDLPYNRFLLLQLAADQVNDARKADLAAMGFLTLGRRFLGVRRDVIDDRIDVVCRGMMGLTVGCARCHDHKYDPIPTADYYALYGVFDSCIEDQVALTQSLGDAAFEQELRKRQTALQDALDRHRHESGERVRSRLGDYLFAQSQLHQYPADGFDQIFEADDILPAFVRRWESYLYQAQKLNDPIFSAWHAFAAIPEQEFSQRSADVTASLQQSTSTIHPLIGEAMRVPPKSFREVCDRYAAVFAAVKQDWENVLADAEPKSDADDGTETVTLNKPTRLTNDNEESLRRIMFGDNAPCQVPDGPISHCETYFDSSVCTELWKLQGEVDRWINGASTHVPFALTLVDQATPTQPRVFRRGNPLSQGEEVPRRFLTCLSHDEAKPFRIGSGRLELAQAIIDPSNPLTARVLVNRVWMQHFGSGLVASPSDFGRRAGLASHPELLDWLASQFIEDGWSLKELHRQLLLSNTFKQASTGPIDSSQLLNAMKIDPDNRWLWRMNARRLTFEQFRDSLFRSTDELDVAVGGKPVELFNSPFPKRRSLYGLVDRQYLPNTLRMFDFANPDLHVPRRSETTVPQQALFLMNHPLIIERAVALAKSTDSATSASERVTWLFNRTLQRNPSPQELTDALALVQQATVEPLEESVATAVDWQYGYGAIDEPSQQVATFTPLPHFDGTAWQGGPRFPDSKLGWVQLTADGGHPGNNRNHAAIRRWTVPRAATIQLKSTLTHEPTAGDGIRAFIVSSSSGVLASTTLHHDTKELNVERLQVKPGDTIDFVVDIGDVLNSDQFLWSASLTLADDDVNLSWNSVTDFPAATDIRLAGWEQLAHVLFCSNEFIFID